MGYAAGQTTGQTGVGTTANTTGQTQQAGYGGKGGGQATQPQPTELAQPSQSSSVNTSAPQPVFGGNALGYNISRLSQRMDPSATLPQAQQASSSPVQTPAQAAPTGGKGGGYGELAQLPEVQNFLGQMMQQPQQQQPYGVSGAQAFDPNAYYGQQQPQAYTPPAQTFENPFASQMQQYQQQMQNMQADYQRQLDALKAQTMGMKDTGAEIYDLGPGYEELTNATSTEEQEAANQKQQLIKDIYSPGVRGADINEYFGGVLNMDRGITVDKKGNIIVRDPLNTKNKTGFTIPKGSTVDAEGNIIGPNGNKINIPSRYLASDVDRARYSSGIQAGDTLDEVEREYGAAGINLTGAKIDSKGVVTLKNGTKIPAGAYVDPNGVLRSSSGAKISVKAKDSADYTAPVKTTAKPVAAKVSKPAAKPAAKKSSSKKKAHGGIIHGGMSNRLKHMVGDK